MVKPLLSSTILIVDDNPTNLNVLFDILEQAGFETLFARDGQTAIDRATETDPDLILLDIMMPGLNGFETCELLKKSKCTASIPIIFMTALSETSNVVKGLKSGAVDYVTKPFQNEEILTRIRTHLTIATLTKSLEEKNRELAELNENLENLVEQKSQKLVEQEKSAIIGRMIQGVVHNLKNPLGIISGYNKLILDLSTENDDNVIKGHCEVINEVTGRINQLTDDLLVVNREGQKPISRITNINNVIRKELDLLNIDSHFKNKVKKEIELDDAIECQLVDASILSQILHNLVNNALDAMWKVDDYKKRLKIRTYQDESVVFMEVTDTGCGIPPDDIKKIFDPFYTSKPARGEANNGDEPVGTGLGLYTCRELLKPVGGEISIRSEAGKGTTVTVSLPKGPPN